MRIPPEIVYRDVAHRPAVDALIHEQAAKLDRFCDHITSCRVAIEHPQQHQRAGNPYRVRLDVTVPPGHELVVDRGPGDNEMHARLETVILDAFKAMRRQLQELVARQRGEDA